MDRAWGGGVFGNGRPGPGIWALVWVLGCLAQLQQPALLPLGVYLALAVLAACGLAVMVGGVGYASMRRGPVPGGLRPGPTAPRVLAALCAGFVLAGAVTGLRAHLRLDGAWPAHLEGQDLQLTGRVVGLPQSTEFGLRFEFEIETVHAPAGLEALAGSVVRLTWYGARADSRTTAVPAAQDRWLMLVRLKAPHGLSNPGGSDPELYAWSRGLRATGYVRDATRGARPVRVSPAPTWHLGRIRQMVRDAILARIEDRSAAGVLAALVVGDASAILPADWAVYRATGIAHLVSISGLHVTVFAWVAGAWLGAAWRCSARCCERWPAPHAGLMGGILLAALYAAFSGGGVPAQRTVGMLALAGLLRLYGARWPWPATWAVIAAAVALWDPWSLLTPGFWLSFVAVAVLLATGEPRAGRDRTLERPALIAEGPPRWGWRVRTLWTQGGLLGREQLRISVALAPWTLALFGQLSVVGLLANLVAIPWMTLLVLPLALVGMAWPVLWDLAALALAALGWVLQAMAAWPGAVWTRPEAPWLLVAAAMLGAVLLILRLPAPVRVAGALLLLPWLGWAPPAPAPGTFELLGADVGQGQAVLVRTARHALLYDAGPRWSEESDAGAQVLVPLLRAQGVGLDLLVISHADTDHAGGAAAVLADHPRAGLLAVLPPGHALAAHRSPQVCLAGQRWTWDGVHFAVLHPREQDLEARKPNAQSCVLRVEAANGASALLAGDLEAPQEARLVRERGDPVPAAGSRAPLQADLLLVPHHGSRTSSSAAWLDAVQPRVALVQAGYRNRYGHPAPEVMARYAQRGIPVALSAGCGAARWSSEAPGALRCHRLEARRYWHHAAPAWAGAPAPSASPADQDEAP